MRFAKVCQGVRGIVGLVLLGVSAGSTAAGDMVSEAALLRLVLAGDVEAVETAMTEAQDTGGTTGGRDLFDLFDTTSPVISDFVADWLKAHPESPHAHTAQAWIYHRVGWSLRSGLPAHMVHHRAREAFDHLLFKADDHAMTAFAAAPDLLAAADLLLDMGISGQGSLPAPGLLDTVMKTQPNARTLETALFAANPRWSGTQELGDRICETYGPKVPSWGDTGADKCKLMVSAEYFDFEPRDWFVETLNRVDHPDLKQLRRRATIALDLPNPDWRRDVERMFDDPTYVDVAFAEFYDTRYAGRHPQAPLATPRVLPRAVQWALRQIEHDPYDPELLDILSTTMVWRRFPDGNMAMEAFRDGAPALSVEDLARRRVLASPYHPEAWAKYASVAKTGYSDVAIADRFGRWINAVAYSGHSTLYLIELHNALVFVPRQLDMAIKSNPDAEVRRQASAVDRDKLIHCPIIRARRIIEAICEEFPDTAYGCTPSSGNPPMDISAIWRDTEERNVCLRERRESLDALIFEPIQYDLAGPGGL